MGAGRWIAACLSIPATLPAAPAAAQHYWHCTVLEQRHGVRAELSQDFSGPGQTVIQPVQEVSVSAGGVYFRTSSWPRWRALERPFEPPRRITIGVRLPEQAASRRFTFLSPGVRPFTLRGRLYGRTAGERGAAFEVSDRRRIEALLTRPDWTVVAHHPDGRVQQIVRISMPMTLDLLRELRERQVARMREIQRDPRRHCLLAEDPAATVSR